MSGTPYSDGDKIADTLDFLRNGGDEERAAAYLEVRIDELPQLLGQPQWRREPLPPTAVDEFDLWAVDALDKVL